MVTQSKRLCITSLEALLQRVPPVQVIRESSFHLSVGQKLDVGAFKDFVLQTGYVADGVVDEPGEVAILKDVIDIYPAGASQPMRCYFDEDGHVSELRCYDRLTQRTQSSAETMIVGPASEIICRNDDTEEFADTVPVYRQMMSRYDNLQSVFDIFKPSAFVFEDGVDDRVDEYLDIIDEARATAELASESRLYLDRQAWGDECPSSRSEISAADYQALPSLQKGFAAFSHFVKEAMTTSQVVITGDEQRLARTCNRLQATLGEEVNYVHDWKTCMQDGARLSSIALPWTSGFIDREQRLVVVTCDDVFGPSRGDLSASPPALGAPALGIGDVVVHETHGVGILRDIETARVDEIEQDTVRLEYYGGASLLVPMEEFSLLWRYGSEVGSVALDRLHTDAWRKKRAELENDILDAARYLLEKARERQLTKSPVLKAPQDRYQAFTARFPYSLTADQRAAIEACASDLASGQPMNRLICGDVGYGKTEIALRAAAIVALSGMQVAVVAPTTVLARQHFEVFKRRFAAVGKTVRLLSRAVSRRQLAHSHRSAEDGEIDVIVATHAILSKDVRFRKLGLVIIDEEHRFGAEDKRAMRSLFPNVHCLAMSATPIPRTMQAALVGVQDVSLLSTPPARRRPVRTSVLEFDETTVRLALQRERRRGGQSFFVAPRIADIAPLQRMLTRLAPDFNILVAHGKMAAEKLEDTVSRFSQGHGDVLLSTDIIESGLDVPAANTIFIWRPDRFGLAQLHQLRGRVGRGRAQGLAYLLTERDGSLNEESRARLDSIMTMDRLGAGTSLSMQDLELRGAGILTGNDQAGHIKVIGTSLYQELLRDAVASLRKEKSQRRQMPSFNIGLVATIPSEYVPDPAVRLNLYSRMLRATTPAEFVDLEEEMSDRFGDPPVEVMTLLRLSRIKAQAAAVGVTALSSGPAGIALDFTKRPRQSQLAAWKKIEALRLKGNRVIFSRTSTPPESLDLLEKILIVDQ
nr:DEAD/DEAH box helicase [Rhizobium cauense]